MLLVSGEKGPAGFGSAEQKERWCIVHVLLCIPRQPAQCLFIGRSDAQLMGSLVPKVEEEFNGGLTGCQRGGSYRCYVS